MLQWADKKNIALKLAVANFKILDVLLVNYTTRKGTFRITMCLKMKPWQCLRAATFQHRSCCKHQAALIRAHDRGPLQYFKCSLKCCAVHLSIAPCGSWPQKQCCGSLPALSGACWFAGSGCSSPAGGVCLAAPPRRAQRSPRVPSLLVSFCLFLFWKLFAGRFVNGIVKIKLWGFYMLPFRSDTNTNSILEELWRSGLIQWISKSFWKWV